MGNLLTASNFQHASTSQLNRFKFCEVPGDLREDFFFLLTWKSLQLKESIPTQLRLTESCLQVLKVKLKTIILKLSGFTSLMLVGA